MPQMKPPGPGGQMVSAPAMPQMKPSMSVAAPAMPQMRPPGLGPQGPGPVPGQDLPPEVQALANLSPEAQDELGSLLAGQSQQAPIGPGYGASPVNPSQAMTEGMPSSSLMDRLRMIESGGKDTAVSSAGASGPYQIMRPTAGDPGFGVNPIAWSDVNDPVKSRQFATDYLGAMMRRYKGNPALALAAYNAGAGTVDRMLQSGQGFSSLPRETQQYVMKILGPAGVQMAEGAVSSRRGAV